MTFRVWDGNKEYQKIFPTVGEVDTTTEIKLKEINPIG
jgi:hypothetical protein